MTVAVFPFSTQTAPSPSSNLQRIRASSRPGFDAIGIDSCTRPRGSSRIALAAAPLIAQTPPAAAATALSGLPSLSLVTFPVFGSTRTSDEDPSVTQTAPTPAATETGSKLSRLRS